MERRFFQLSGIESETGNMIKAPGSERTSGRETAVPTCLNTDYCLNRPDDGIGGVLTMAFVNMQPMDSIYSLEDAFENGTLFPNLDKPFWGGKKA